MIVIVKKFDDRGRIIGTEAFEYRATTGREFLGHEDDPRVVRLTFDVALDPQPQPPLAA